MEEEKKQKQKKRSILSNLIFCFAPAMKKTPVYSGSHICSSSVTGGRSKCTYRIDAGEGKPAYAVDRGGHDHLSCIRGD